MSSRWTSHTPLRGGVFAALLAAAGLLAFAGALIAVGTAQASTLPTLRIAISPSSATVGGTLESGGVNVVTTDTGVKEATEILFLLKPGVSVAEAEAFISTKKAHKDPNNTDKLGSIVFDTEVSPGRNSEVQTDLQPGQYLLLIGEGEGEVKLRSTFTVSASTAPAALPTPGATIRSIEFGFRGPSTLHDGEIVRFENEGFLVHMDIAARVKNMAAAKRAIKLLRAGNEKQLEKLIVGPPTTFAGPLSHEAFQQETITAKPGIYVEVCFMDTEDGRSHTLLGMERIIRITK
ncbi:MAG: hypothetical protein ABSG95_11740 [Solirubrobacteraceae bacterium]|jgi:hypothetical protein